MIKHCLTIMHYAKQITKGENQTILLYHSLSSKANNYYSQFMYPPAKLLLEEAYDLVAEAYNPLDPTVLGAANQLVAVYCAMDEC